MKNSLRKLFANFQLNLSFRREFDREENLLDEIDSPHRARDRK